MSTDYYLVCMDHEPRLRAMSESGQHDYDLPQIRADIADREDSHQGLRDRLHVGRLLPQHHGHIPATAPPLYDRHSGRIRQLALNHRRGPSRGVGRV